MTIYSLYIFSKRGSCVYYAEWQRPRNPLADEPSEDRKLMFGLVHSLKTLMNKLSPTCVEASGGWRQPLQQRRGGRQRTGVQPARRPRHGAIIDVERAASLHLLSVCAA